MTECIVQKEWYSVKQCKENLDTLYVFGDNLEGVGCGGQAQIRYCVNSYGIPTKRSPSMDENSFFHDQPDEHVELYYQLTMLLQVKHSGIYKKIVFPSDGLGTGLAKMDEKSPKLFKMMNDIILDYFDVDLNLK